MAVVACLSEYGIVMKFTSFIWDVKTWVSWFIRLDTLLSLRCLFGGRMRYVF